jgi:hypothetical protein
MRGKRERELGLYRSVVADLEFMLHGFVLTYIQASFKAIQPMLKKGTKDDTTLNGFTITCFFGHNSFMKNTKQKKPLKSLNLIFLVRPGVVQSHTAHCGSLCVEGGAKNRSRCHER